MTRLIKSDFKKFFCDKLFLIVLILAAVFAVITPILYVLIFEFAGEMDATTEQMLSGYLSAKGQFFGSFSFGNNLGLIAPILIGIILCKDFSFGTVRNKIISGHSRTSVFLSNFIVCATVLFGIMLAHALLTLFVSLPFFEYQSIPFKAEDFYYLLESLFFQFLIYLFVAAFVTWLSVVMKNTGLVIVMYIAVVFGFTMIAGILQIAIIALETKPDMNKLVEFLNFLQRINIFNSSAAVGVGTSYNAKDVVYYAFIPIVSTAAVLGHGILKFGKKDLK